jgi:hypothetical protein
MSFLDPIFGVICHGTEATHLGAIAYDAVAVAARADRAAHVAI